MNEANGSEVKIKAIDKKVVHRICSGQVVLSLANAVKELLENSLDANSTSIDIRLRGYGAESVEVVDNGSGIQEKDFQALTLKHYTSKLNCFDDLVGVRTYGFRGEALSSLCALSDVIIITRHDEVAVGTKIEFDHDGKIIKTSIVPRQVGTTVIIKNLFGTLAVRHKEFNKNIKKEFSKMLNCIYNYCLISENVRIMCSNQTNKGKTIMISSNPNSNIKERISSIFGHKQAINLLDIEMHCPSLEILEEYNLKEGDIDSLQISLCGHVSSCRHGSGRSSADRQFYYINKRPCDLPRVSKLVNEVYHLYNHCQFPFIMLDISLKKELVDVNVTPDKRSLFLDKEKVLLAVIKSSLKVKFESDPGILGSSLAFLAPTKNKSNSETILASGKSVIENVLDSTSEIVDEDLNLLESCVEINKVEESVIVKNDIREQNAVNFFSGFKRKSSGLSSPGSNSNKKPRSLKDYFYKFESNKVTSDSRQIKNNDKDILPPYTNLPNNSLEKESGYSVEFIECGINSLKPENSSCEISRTNSDCAFEEEHLNIPKINVQDEIVKKIVRFSIKYLRNSYTAVEHEVNRATVTCRKFKAKIEPESNDLAENELKKELTKNMFKEMTIIGQFNLGFIITKCDNDLFIIDQHATDEKCNFEDLKKNQVLETQKLIIPRPLHLTAANEIILFDNLEIFKKNGFIFSNTDEACQSDNKMSLVGVPVSRNWTFGKEDIEEMLFMMSDGVNMGGVYRPSRIQQMLASRACRKSVMIGTALNVSVMQKLVHHMAEMEQPWNCPHGRPTIRHLINLNSIQLL